MKKVILSALIVVSAASITLASTVKHDSASTKKEYSTADTKKEYSTADAKQAPRHTTVNTKKEYSTAD